MTYNNEKFYLIRTYTSVYFAKSLRVGKRLWFKDFQMSLEELAKKGIPYIEKATSELPFSKIGEPIIVTIDVVND